MQTVCAWRQIRTSDPRAGLKLVCVQPTDSGLERSAMHDIHHGQLFESEDRHEYRATPHLKLRVGMLTEFESDSIPEVPMWRSAPSCDAADSALIFSETFTLLGPLLCLAWLMCYFVCGCVFIYVLPSLIFV